MKTILILGSGCFRCTKLHELALAAATESDVECEVIKVSDPSAIAGFGVMSTPAIIIDGELKSAEKMLSVEQIKKLLED